MMYGSSGGQDEEDQVFEQLPLLDSVQEIITKEKLVLEFSLAEKDETIAILQAQCAELEQALKQKHQMAKALRISSQDGSSPFAFPDAADVLVGHCLNLSNRGLNLRRFPLIIKQYRCIKKQVDTLVLDRNNLDDDCLGPILEMINCKPLRRINLANNDLGERTGSSIFTCLKTNRELQIRLEALQLDGNPLLANSPVLTADLVAMLKELWTKKALTKLWWIGLTLNDYHAPLVRSSTTASPLAAAAGGGNRGPVAAAGGAKTMGKKVKAKDPMNALAFVRFLKSKDRQPIQALELKHARLSLKTIEAFGQGEALRSLTSLDLTNACIGPMGARSLSKTIIAHKDNINLIHLGLRGNLLVDFGVTALATALITNTSLTSLDLRANYIRDKGVFALIHVLHESNTTITALRLGNNCFTSSTLVKFQRLIQSSKHNGTGLMMLDLEGHRGGVSLRTQIERLLERKKENVRAICCQDQQQQASNSSGSSGKEHVLVAWPRNQVQKESFSASKDGYACILSSVLPEHVFGSINMEAREKEEKDGLVGREVDKHAALVVRIQWSAKRVTDQQQGGGKEEKSSRWKLLRERGSEVTTSGEGTWSQGHEAGGGFRQVSLSIADCAPDDRLLLKIGPCNEMGYYLPRQGATKEEIHLRDLRMTIALEKDFGLVYQQPVPPPSHLSSAMAASYSDQRWDRPEWQKEVETHEALKLALKLGEGSYRCVYEICVPVNGPNFDMVWEARQLLGNEDDEDDNEHSRPAAVVGASLGTVSGDGGRKKMLWAIIKRSMGSSTIVASGVGGRASTSNLFDWQRIEASVASPVLAGDVLALWLGSSRQGSKQREASFAVQNLKLFLRNKEQDEKRSATAFHYASDPIDAYTKRY